MSPVETPSRTGVVRSHIIERTVSGICRHCGWTSRTAADPARHVAAHPDHVVQVVKRRVSVVQWEGEEPAG